MALSKEDKNDVKRAYGKALANKVSKVTKDKGRKVKLSDAFPGESRMDKLKSRVGSDNRGANYKAMYKSMKRHENRGISSMDTKTRLDALYHARRKAHGL